LKTFFQTKKYVVRQGGDIDKIQIIKELHDAYKNDLSYKEEIKKRKEALIIKAKNKAKEIFKKLPADAKEEYFKKVYDESR